MSDEALSALIDGECSPAELDRLLEAMDRDSALKARYTRLCLAREALRGARIRTVPADFAGRVLAALDGAPSSVVPIRARPAMVWRPLVGLAAAAGLAAVALLALRPDTGTPQPAMTAAEAPDAGRHWTELDAENARRLNGYLAAYSQSRAQHGVGGTLSHARYAAHTVEAPPAPAETPEAQR